MDAYWTETLSASGLPEPRVRYSWVPPGERQRTGCGVVADDGAAFYCPADDTIYVAQRFAADLYAGVARGLPGERAGYGRAAGDFGVAYVLAHEYAHNLQNELGLFRLGRRNSSRPIELQADCLAGAWGNSVYAEGRLRPRTSRRPSAPRSRSATSTSRARTTTARRRSAAARGSTASRAAIRRSAGATRRRR